MLNFQEMFNDSYQHYLDEISYKKIEGERSKEKTDIQINDSIRFEMTDNRELKVRIERVICFEPHAVYDLTVAYAAIFTLKDEAKVDDDVDWKKEFNETPICRRLIQGTLARISVLISQITFSEGKNPLVTPPNLIND